MADSLLPQCSGDAAHDRLRTRVEATKAAAVAALRAPEWVCDDGHKHPRPDEFTLRRLATEVERRNRRNDWTSSEVSLGIYALMDDGTLVADKRWKLRVA